MSRYDHEAKGDCVWSVNIRFFPSAFYNALGSPVGVNVSSANANTIQYATHAASDFANSVRGCFWRFFLYPCVISSLHAIEFLTARYLNTTVTIEGQLSNVAVETYNFGASAPFDSTSQIPFSGGSRGKAAFNTMTITRKSDTFSPLLYKAMFSNTNFDVVLKESLPDPSGKPECMGYVIKGGKEIIADFHDSWVQIFVE